MSQAAQAMQRFVDEQRKLRAQERRATAPPRAGGKGGKVMEQQEDTELAIEPASESETGGTAAPETREQEAEGGDMPSTAKVIGKVPRAGAAKRVGRPRKTATAAAPKRAGRPRKAAVAPAAAKAPRAPRRDVLAKAEAGPGGGTLFLSCAKSEMKAILQAAIASKELNDLAQAAAVRMLARFGR